MPISSFCDKEIRYGHKNQNQQRKSAGLEVEEEADEKEECVTHKSLVPDQRKYDVHYRKECPEVELGEQ